MQLNQSSIYGGRQSLTFVSVDGSNLNETTEMRSLRSMRNTNCCCAITSDTNPITAHFFRPSYGLLSCCWKFFYVVNSFQARKPSGIKCIQTKEKFNLPVATNTRSSYWLKLNDSLSFQWLQSGISTKQRVQKVYPLRLSNPINKLTAWLMNAAFTKALQ